MEKNVLEQILEGSMKPTDLPLETLREITNNFSTDRVIGGGGFSTVYKGVLRNGNNVAVKKIMSNMTIDEKLFHREVDSLMEVNHENAVRFLGFCSHTVKTAVKNPEARGYIYAEKRERLLCFEYINNGSLDNYITDELRGLDWDTRFQIIKGICMGLCYLHMEKGILHMDLKPANILLDNQMVPKITDFGLSRPTENSQTTSTKHFCTPGYAAPENRFFGGRMSVSSDIYSLGAIIIELVTGHKGVPNNSNNVLRKWRHRWNKSSQETQQAYQQVTKCIEIGRLCQDIDPVKRPFISNIVNEIREMESMNNHVKDADKSIFGQVVPVEYSRGVLQVHPLELRFPMKPSKHTSCLLCLTNNTNEHVAFGLQEKGGSNLAYLGIFSMHGIVPPRSTYTLAMTRRELAVPIGGKPVLPEAEFGLILQTSVVNENIQPFGQTNEFRNFFEQVEERDDALNEVILKVVCDLQEGTTSKFMPLAEHTCLLWCLDAHPTEPWIIRGDHAGRVHIWNYDTQASDAPYDLVTATSSLYGFITLGIKSLFKASTVWSTKIVARKQWGLAGDGDGYIHVYHYGAKPKKIRSFKGSTSYCITSLAIHPTKPYVLSANSLYIDLWDWEDDWKRMQTFKGHSSYVSQVAFNPRDHDSFVSASSDYTVKVWNLNSPESTCTLSGHSGRVTSLDFFTRDDQQYLITVSSDRTAKIWDMLEKTCIHTIEVFTSPVTCVISLPDRPYLVTGSEDGLVRLWSSSDYKLERIFDTGLRFGNARDVRALAYSMESKGLVIGQRDVVTVFNIDDCEPVVIQGDDENSK